MFKRTIQQHFHRAASSYDQVAHLQRHYISRAHEMLAPLQTNALVADIACGTGYFSQLTTHPCLVGVDLAEGMCKRAAKHTPHVSQADMHALPLASELFDLSFCAFALQWSSDPAKVIHELSRITKPDGQVAVLTFLDGTLAELSKACKLADQPSRVRSFYTATQYQQWLHHAGLTIKHRLIETQQTNYASVMEFFKELKAMGATQSSAGLTTKTQLEKLVQAYEQVCGAKLAASWQVGVWICKKL